MTALVASRPLWSLYFAGKTPTFLQTKTKQTQEGFWCRTLFATDFSLRKPAVTHQLVGEYTFSPSDRVCQWVTDWSQGLCGWGLNYRNPELSVSLWLECPGYNVKVYKHPGFINLNNAQVQFGELQFCTTEQAYRLSRRTSVLTLGFQ